MPTKREREYYRMGFMDAMQQSIRASGGTASGEFTERINGRVYDELGQAYPRYPDDPDSPMGRMVMREDIARTRSKPKRKLSAWQRYIKNKRNHITYRDGKLNLKAMGVQYRKKTRR